MTLIKSISGIRGTIGGPSGKNLTPLDIVECVTGYGQWLQTKGGKKIKVVVGRDGRISGPMVAQLSIQTLLSMGIDVINLDLSTTPTVEMAVLDHNANGGIIFTASHNPKEWNALKFLNGKSEFISAEDGEQIIEFIQNKKANYSTVNELGNLREDHLAIKRHIDHIINLPIIDLQLIKNQNFTVVVDCINSTGSLAIPELLNQLSCKSILLNEEMSGDFAHKPEPLPENLNELISLMKENRADLGVAVDPDVDRLALVCEDGSYFGEEYTLVAAADFVLSKTPGNTVSNLSSTRALSDITKKYGHSYFASAVGEVNVVNTMKANNAVIGGEGNGGVIYPALHYGRDALVGIAFILNLMAQKGKTLSSIRKEYTDYKIIKNKIDLKSEEDLHRIYSSIKNTFQNEKLNDIDGMKIDFAEGWVHVRKSNTEPIIRIYAEAKTEKVAQKLIDQVISSFS